MKLVVSLTISVIWIIGYASSVIVIMRDVQVIGVELHFAEQTQLILI